MELPAERGELAARLALCAGVAAAGCALLVHLLPRAAPELWARHGPWIEAHKKLLTALLAAGLCVLSLALEQAETEEACGPAP